MKIEFDTREYEFNHGHKPRGFGSWAFEFEKGKPIFIPGSHTLTNAKRVFKLMVEEMVKNGTIPSNLHVLHVTVCS